MGKYGWSGARGGKVKNQTPKVHKQDKPKKPTGRAKMRHKYNTRILSPLNSYSVNSPFNQELRREWKEKSGLQKTKKKNTIIPYTKDQVSGLTEPKKLKWNAIRIGEITSGSLPIPRCLRAKTIKNRYLYCLNLYDKRRSHAQETNRIHSNQIRFEMKQKKNLKTFEVDDDQFCEMLYVLFSNKYSVEWQYGLKYLEDFSSWRSIEGWKGGIMSIIKKRIPRKTLSTWTQLAINLFRHHPSQPFHHFLSILHQELQ